SYPTSLDTADLDLDGSVDLAVATMGDGVILLLGNGDGTFQAPSALALESQLVSIRAADLDGDGDMDLAVGCGVDEQSEGIMESVFALENDSGVFSTAQRLFLPSLGDPVSMCRADFDGDGVIDLAVARENYHVNVLLGVGDCTFVHEQEIDAGVWPRCILAGDVDEDEIPDITVLHSSASDSTLVLLGSGDGTFLPAPKVATPSGCHGGALRDLDGDGYADLAVSSNGLAIYPGNGDGTFGMPVIYSPQSLFVLAEDLDGDGYTDLAAVSAMVRVLTNITALTGDYPGLPHPADLISARNYPNPFNPVTTIRFYIPEPGRVVLRVYDAAGRLVDTLSDGFREAGTHDFVWDGKGSGGRGLCSGVYFLRIDAGKRVFSR
ncbi:MAG TPA: FG-GAP-like repeat-containing protein, partial [Candidatus Krumholzibacterium sp.]|nr:FG-GAP-like repeat-containing protein [Candidatus Krumholzibacterium sp.]